MILKRIKGILCLTIVFIFGCSKSADQTSSVGQSGDISIAYLKSHYAGSPYTITQNYKICGVVVSTDKYANIQNSVFIQDSTGGIKINISDKLLSEKYWIGDSLYVSCQTLALGSYGGNLSLGLSPDGYFETNFIPEIDQYKYITKLGHSEYPPEPHNLSISEITGRYLNCYVCFEDVQFSQIDISWGNNDDYTTHYLTDRSDNTLIVRISPTAKFRHLTIPSGSGKISGILSYFNKEYQLLLNSDRDVNMNGVRF